MIKQVSENFYSKKSTLIGIAIIMLLLVCIAYSNHFNNGWKFDDFHTIVYNEYIKDIKNIPSFFTDIKYFGTTPGNQGFRPILVTFNTIDYWIAGGLNPVYFHADIFLFYILQLVLMFFMIRKILDIVLPSDKNKFYSLLITGFYSVHASNAETINYICQRSDAFSTLCIIASILLYLTPFARKYYLYLITAVLGLVTKETGAMFGPILFFYILLFEENITLVDLILFKKIKGTFKAFLKALPAIIFSLILYFILLKIIGHGKIKDNSPISHAIVPFNIFQGFITQWVVIMHYLGNFFIPLDLSGETEVRVYYSFFNIKVIFSLLVILCLIVIAVYTSISKRNRPIAFGIVWFFLALTPTTYGSLHSNGQLANDHRTFFPYIGLVISLGWWLCLLYMKYELNINKFGKGVIAMFIILVFSLHTYGTYQRNKVWATELSLWEDSVKKSPDSFNSQMNYGVALMANGQYDDALGHFKKAYEIKPNHSYIQINMALALAGTGKSKEAEEYFKLALLRQPTIPEVYFFYAKWLSSQPDRIDEAIKLLEKGHEVSPKDAQINELLPKLTASNKSKGEKLKNMEDLVKTNPSVDNFINLSLLYYENNKYKECIDACLSVLKLQPKNAIAYNNMCCAYNALSEWDKAVDACNKSLEINQDYKPAKNNLKASMNKEYIKDDSDTNDMKQPTAQKYLDLSVKYYNENQFEKCIEAANNAVKLKSNYSEAYNNIGMAYLKLKEYDKSIEAFKRALSINPENNYAKNNLNNAIKQKNGK